MDKEIFAIFGNPVEHSKSPQMHNKGFQTIDYKGEYVKHLIEDEKTIKDTFLKNLYKGANITVPHKEEAFKQADEVIGIANEIEAVNTYINQDGKVIAYNTDALGFLKAIKSFGKIKKVLVLGAGGTAKAIAFALKEQNIEVTILNRSANKLKSFEKKGFATYSWDNFQLDTFDLVVNSTSAGLKDEQLPCKEELLNSIFNSSNFAFDCIYGKQTPFLKLAKDKGLQTKDGEDMLLFQGLLAFELFTNTKANEELIEAMRQSLKEK